MPTSFDTMRRIATLASMVSSLINHVKQLLAARPCKATLSTCQDARPIDLKMCQNKHPVSIWCCKAVLVECFRKQECNLWMPLAVLKTKEADRNLLPNHARILYALVVFNFIQVVRSLLLDLPLSTPWPGLRGRIVWASHWTIRNPGNNLGDSKMSLSH